MAYIIRSYYDPEKNELRLKIRPQHVEHLRAHKDKLLAAGPLNTPDGTPSGGLTIYDSDDLAEVEAFRQRDPYFKNGILKDAKVMKWRKTIFDHKDYGH